MKTRKHTKKHRTRNRTKHRTNNVVRKKHGQLLRRGGTATKTTTRSRTNMRSTRTNATPYTLKRKQTQSPELLNELDKVLRNCKETELMMTMDHKNKKQCVHGHKCNRTNPTHYHDFSHPINSAVIAQPFKMCADKFVDLSYKLFDANDNSLPKEWYIIIANHLRESDYTIYTSLYFNILANLCIHHEEYAREYPDNRFWSHFYTGMEEGAAVTGMYDVTGIPRLSQCLKDMNSVDPRYLSNTALLFSKTYG